ncbi:hypothetical protein LEP1GSC070_0440 [Leptospira santarosai str. AIM]|nr:hypothetical protein LEP1GSC070_0440 [Leptospira santarosai str. AIM]
MSVGFSKFFICFFLFCFGLLFSILILCFTLSSVDGVHGNESNDVPTDLRCHRALILISNCRPTNRNEIEWRTSNELSTCFTFLSSAFDTEQFHPAQKSEPLVDRLMTLCLSFQMKKAKKHSNYKRFILL